MPVAARQSCSTSQVHTTEIPPLDKARLLLGLGWGLWAGAGLGEGCSREKDALQLSYPKHPCLLQCV